MNGTQTARERYEEEKAAAAAAKQQAERPSASSPAQSDEAPKAKGKGGKRGSRK